MKYTLTKNLSFLVAFFLIVSSCQDSSMTEVEAEDKDMIEASKLADEFLNSDEARHASKVSITVLHYSGGKLYFATNTDNFKNYNEVTEETITASLSPGEIMFWFAGAGVNKIEGIEFDQVSQSKLDDAPQGSFAGKLWSVRMPDHLDTSELLKYDIIYQYWGNRGAPIRLDPKLKVDPEPEP